MRIKPENISIIVVAWCVAIQFYVSARFWTRVRRYRKGMDILGLMAATLGLSVALVSLLGYIIVRFPCVVQSYLSDILYEGAQLCLFAHVLLKSRILNPPAVRWTKPQLVGMALL